VSSVSRLSSLVGFASGVLRGQWFVKQVHFRVLYVHCIRTHVLYIYTHTVDHR
jgi:hypothetical protein